jgi:hypothetical protein
LDQAAGSRRFVTGWIVRGHGIALATLEATLVILRRAENTA